MIRKYSSLIIIFILIQAAAFSQSTIDTAWSGFINIYGTKLGIIVSFKTENNVLGAKIDIPEQNAKALELKQVSFDNPKVHFELESTNGQAVFEGLYYTDSISGNFTQSTIKGTFSLIKGIPVIEITATLPYNAEEVAFTNDGNTFTGTLTYPKTSGKHPAVVMITGSGAQDRDENIFGFKIFKEIADHLTKNGIAVLRYDDRGVGGSKGKTVNQSTTEDFAGDVIAAVQYLKTRDNINPSQIGLMGHSEGGVVAPLAASKSNDIAFIILMAGTGVSGYDILKEQTALIMKADKSTDEEIEGYLKMIDAVYDAIKNNKSLDDVKKQIKNDLIENFDNIPEKQRKDIKDKEKYANDVAEQTIAEFNTAWMKYFIQYDPAPALTKVKCPVLALFGEKDLQVPAKQNRSPMEDALKKGGNKDYKIIVMPKANHLFQEANTGSPSEYGALKKEFVPGFLEAVSGWILQRVSVKMKTRNVGILIFNDVEVLDFSGPFEVFNVANEISEEKSFNVFTIAENENTVSAKFGYKINPQFTIHNCPELDILVIPGGNGRKIQMNNPVITDWVKDVFDKLELLLTVCTGVFIAGKAGVLNVKKATTHHDSYDEFEKTFPGVELIRNVKYVDNGKIITSGGISAGINMSLFVIDKLIGSNHGKKTAVHMEYDY